MRAVPVHRVSCVLVLVLLGAASAARAAATFTGLGTLLENSTSVATGVSADGSTVVGSVTENAGAAHAFRWTTSTGMVELPVIPGADDAEATAISADGAVVVGQASGEAVRWTSGGVSGLGISGIAYGTSGDGSVVVGEDYSAGAFRWTQDGAASLGTLPGDDYSIALGVSGDGSTVIGTSFPTVPDVGPQEAFLWTSAGGMVSVATLPGVLDSEASAISVDGSVVVGSASGPGFEQAFRWTAAGGMVLLGLLPGVSDGNTVAYAVSADGSVIVGEAYDAAIGRSEAFVWDAVHGMRSLPDLLATEYALDLTGWSVETATGVSADGLTIVGYGHSPDLDQEAWIAVIPEPATGVLLALGLAGFAARRRRR